MRIVETFLCAFGALALCGSVAQAAPLCVDKNLSSCYPTISAAVAAAAPGDNILVAPGTYKESVTITRPLSLTGVGATINATGLSRGIFIDGIGSAPKLTGVHVAGFTIKNANFEGILIANASDVTVSNNTVTDNNKALDPSAGTCPNIEAFEPGEQMDCGEGIHLLGADHAVVTNNIVKNNSGGILLSDDIGATHHNLISFNTVKGNLYACGIVLASHPQASISPSATPLGVHNNTIYGNHSENNGLQGTGGAGIGLFAAVPGAQVHGNVIANNTINDNGHPGISMHGHIPGQNLANNMLIANTISGNGADTADATTAGPTGIDLYAAGKAPGNIVSANTIDGETLDVVTNTQSKVQVEFNNLLGRGTGLDNPSGKEADASWNYWGCLLGPNLGPNCSKINGNNIVSAPWMIVPVTPYY